MSVQIQQAISRSSTAFLDVVWPQIGPVFGGGQIIPVETVTDSEMAKLLDTRAGIDMWLVLGDSMYGLASRVQWSDTSWDTFTVRRSLPSGASTEFDKRRHAITSGALYPRLTVQAYVSKDGSQLLSAAAIDTRHLIEMAERYDHQRRTAPGGNQFVYINWEQCEPGKVIVHRPVAA
jgi:hypothetical protein